MLQRYLKNRFFLIFQCRPVSIQTGRELVLQPLKFEPKRLAGFYTTTDFQKKRFDMRSIFISANHPRSRHLRASPQWSSQRRRVRQGTSWYPCSSLWSTVGSEQRTETRLQWSCPTNTSGQFNNFRSIIFWLLQSWEIFTCTISSSFCDLLFSTVTPGCILTFKGKQMF